MKVDDIKYLNTLKDKLTKLNPELKIECEWNWYMHYNEYSLYYGKDLLYKAQKYGIDMFIHGIWATKYYQIKV